MNPAGPAAAGAVGVDTGGTFTDAVDASGHITKVPSTPHDPAVAVAAAVASLASGPPAILAHGTTVATNALLERRGAAVTLLTTTGLADVIEIARQNRPSLYDQAAVRPVPLVPRERRVEVSGRLDATGRELEPLELGGVPVLPTGTESVAIVLLHSDIDPTHERELAAAVRRAHPGLDVVASHAVSPEFREYERTVTTVVDAFLRPVCRAYLGRLAPLAAEVAVMTSAGGLVGLDEARERPASLLLSGPAGGVRAGAAAAVAAGFGDAVTFDMGGTSTDVCLVLDGRPEPASQRSVAGFPIRLPALDIHTIGAGGGSLARIDAGGALVVGPESAGAVPGPACYGAGGLAPTVTDADLVAGRLPTELGGIGELDVGAAQRALDDAGLSAEGVIAVVDASMVEAVRAVTVARGVDPRGLALVAFGGAGPLHAVAVAAALGMPAVVVPPRAGVLSAVGMLASARHAVAVRSWPHPTDHAAAATALDDLAADVRRSLPPRGEVIVETAVDCRYAGQSHEITVADAASFPAEHERRNGYARPGSPVEVVALRARATTAPLVDVAGWPAPSRASAVGPAVLTEPDCTVWMPAGWVADVHPSGAWILTPADAAASDRR